VCSVICGQADKHAFSFLLETIISKIFMNLKPNDNNTANTFCVHLMVYLVGSVGVIETSLILFKSHEMYKQCNKFLLILRTVNTSVLYLQFASFFSTTKFAQNIFHFVNI